LNLCWQPLATSIARFAAVFALRMARTPFSSKHEIGARMQARSHGLVDLFRFEPRIRILHLTWLAFFVSFVIWFNHAPLLVAIRSSFGLTDAEISALLILNV